MGLKKLKNFRGKNLLPFPPLLLAVAHQVKRAKKNARRAVNISKQADEMLAAAVGGALSTTQAAAAAATVGTEVAIETTTCSGQIEGGVVPRAAVTAATTETTAAGSAVTVGKDVAASTAAVDDGSRDEEVLMAQLAAQTRAEGKADRAVQMLHCIRRRQQLMLRSRLRHKLHDGPQWRSIMSGLCWRCRRAWSCTCIVLSLCATWDRSNLGQKGHLQGTWHLLGVMLGCCTAQRAVQWSLLTISTAWLTGCTLILLQSYNCITHVPSGCAGPHREPTYTGMRQSLDDDKSKQLEMYQRISGLVLLTCHLALDAMAARLRQVGTAAYDSSLPCLLIVYIVWYCSGCDAGLQDLEGANTIGRLLEDIRPRQCFTALHGCTGQVRSKP